MIDPGAIIDRKALEDARRKRAAKRREMGAPEGTQILGFTGKSITASWLAQITLEALEAHIAKVEFTKALGNTIPNPSHCPCAFDDIILNLIDAYREQKAELEAKK